ncbi:MAG: response regulator transcription factor [Saprospiraceae bacterium]|nr:response regulator transcription factor [Saprospiraceae bacterium]MBK7789166.1 response regulator transcription factor [Saprospiraceae bacterium]
MSPQSLRILIIDDEAHNRKAIKRIIEEGCPSITIIGEASSAEEARQILKNTQTDVVLLDINMPNENGFSFLNSMKGEHFLTVFITAYAEHAIRAFKANAIDYILKPIDEAELIEAIEKCRNLLPNIAGNNGWANYSQSLVHAIDVEQQIEYPKKFTLPHSSGFHIVSVADITHFVADGNYTSLHFISSPSMLISRPIREFEEILDPNQFFRIHKSSIINLKYLKSYSTAEGNEAILSNGLRLPVSRRRLEDFMQIVNAVSRKL